MDIERNATESSNILHILLMKTSETFHPVLPNVTLYDRMFRAKPYTKCIDCLTQDRLRCHKCMELIIDNISKKSNPKKVTEIRRLSPNAFSQHTANMWTKKNTQFSAQKLHTQGGARPPRSKENQERVMITSKYNWWLGEMKRKKEAAQLSSTSLGSWPRKTRVNDYNL